MKGRHLINEDGAAIAIIMLFLIPLLIMVNVYYNENERLLTGSNVTIKNAVSIAAKSAAQSVESISQANGNPMIAPALAHENFKRILRRNLKLDSNMQPLSGSPVIGDIDYYLLICNGENTVGLDEGVIYKRENGSVETILLNTGELPKTFGVNTDFNINGDKTVTFDTPGVMAIVKGTVRPVALTVGQETIRWASARIIMPHGERREEAR